LPLFCGLRMRCWLRPNGVFDCDTTGFNASRVIIKRTECWGSIVILQEKPMTTDEFKCQAESWIAERSLESDIDSYVNLPLFPTPPKALIWMLTSRRNRDLTQWIFTGIWDYFSLSRLFPEDAWRSGERMALLVHKSTQPFWPYSTVDWLWSSGRRFFAMVNWNFYMVKKRAPFRGPLLGRGMCACWGNLLISIADITKVSTWWNYMWKMKNTTAIIRDGCVFRESINILR